MVKLEVKGVATVTDGEYQGVISEVLVKPCRDGAFEYLNVIIDSQTKEKEPFSTKYSFPNNVTNQSTFGKFWLDMGLSLPPPKQTIDTDELLGKKVTFKTITRVSPTGTFSNIEKGSLKPRK